MEVKLKFRGSNEIPDKDSSILIVAKTPFGLVTYQSRCTKGVVVHFLDYEVAAWAYFIEEDEIMKTLRWINFDEEWINFLNENAKTK